MDGKDVVMLKLAKISADMDKATTDGLIEVGERGVAIWKPLTPVVSGRTRMSESYTIDGRVYGVGDDKVNVSHDDKMVIIGTNVVYGPSVEFTSTTGSKGFTARAYNRLKQVVDNVMIDVYKRGVL